MRRLVAIAALQFGILASGSAIAVEQQVTLRVENMFCASCPFIIKQTLARVPGVSHVEISYEEEKAEAIAIVVYLVVAIRFGHSNTGGVIGAKRVGAV